MKPEGDDNVGPITDFLVKDHGRLEALLQSAVAQADAVDQGMYDQFRAGLLRHIGMEEKIFCRLSSGPWSKLVMIVSTRKLETRVSF
jgi:hypothetical protein